MVQRNSNKRFIFGVILIVLGVFLILEKLGLISEAMSDLLISWQMLLIGIGILSTIGGNRTSGTVLIVVGTVFLVPELIDVPHTIKEIYWPLILVAIGIIILLRQRNHQPHNHFQFQKPNEPDLNAPTNNNSFNSFNTFDDFVIFGGREVLITSSALAGGKATSIFGGIEFDLRKANLQPGGAIIDCVSVFGGCGFKIPMDWNVRNEVTTIFGAFTDKRGETYSDKYYDPSKTIVIKGVSIFGGIEVKHF